MTTRGVQIGLAGIVMLLALAWPGAARASTYLDAAALLLDETRKSSDWVQSHFGDVRLAELAHQLSEARVKAGRTLAVPKDFERAHPHLLLTLEISERALAAAVDHEGPRFLRLAAQARDEERTFRAILGQQKVPDLDRR